MNLDFFDKKKVTFYISRFDATTRSSTYTKSTIDNCVIFEDNIAGADSTGIKNNRNATVLIPHDTAEYAEPDVKLGDYFVEGEAEDFTTLDELKKNHRVYKIEQHDVKTYGNAPHTYIKGV